MKLAIPLAILNRFLNTFNNKKIYDEKTPNKYAKSNYWDRECLEHPTNNSCLIYCDQTKNLLKQFLEFIINGNF